MQGTHGLPEILSAREGDPEDDHLPIGGASLATGWKTVNVTVVLNVPNDKDEGYASDSDT